MQTLKEVVFEIQKDSPDKDKINLTNQFQLCPFFIYDEKKEIQICEQWYKSNVKVLDDFTQVAKDQGYSLCFINDFTIPHEIQSLSHSIFWNLYTSYVCKFDYDVWLKMLSPSAEEVIPGVKRYLMQESPVYIIKLKKMQTDLLKEIGTKRVITGNNISKDDLEDFSDLVPILEEILGLIGERGAFVKSQCKSCKNDIALRPLKTPEDIIENLTSSKDIVTRWKESDNLLIVMPFLKELDRMKEFRVIVLNGRIAGISQQLWHKALDWTPDATTFEAIEYLWTQELAPKFHYGDVVLDVYIDSFNKAKLIECNPGGVWCASGSALFSWVTDLDLLNSDTIPFRIYQNIAKEI